MAVSMRNLVLTLFVVPVLLTSIQLNAQRTKPRETAPPAMAPPSSLPANEAGGLGASKILEEARRIEAHTESQLSMIVTLMEVFLGVVTIVTIILVGVGLKEWKQVSDKVSKAEESVSKATKAASDAELAAERARLALSELAIAVESSKQISTMKESLIRAWGDIDQAFETLPDVEAEWVLGMDAPVLAPEIGALFEDRDVLLMICDHLKIPADPARSVTAFLRLAQYWRITRRFPKALARIERAIILSPDDHMKIKLHLARTLAHWAALEPEPAEPRAERLNRALVELRTIEASRGQQLPAGALFDIAWVLDELGMFDEAVEYSFRARDAVRRECKEDGNKEPWTYSYNLACSLAKSKRNQEALTALQCLVGTGPKWIYAAEQDRDFSSFREDEEWRTPFEGLLRSARQAISLTG